MSLIYKCDRCNHRLRSIDSQCRIKFFDKHSKNYDWDLCPKCKNAFYEFMGIDPNEEEAEDGE